MACLCLDFQVLYVVNNAYRVQSREVCKRIATACHAGRVDAGIECLGIPVILLTSDVIL